MGVAAYVFVVIQPPLVELQAAHVEKLRPCAVGGGGQVDIAVGNRAAGADGRRGAFHITQFGNRIAVGHGERFHFAASPVAEAFTGEHGNGVRAHAVDVGQDFFLRAAPQCHHGHHRRNADDNPQHGQHRAHFVRHNRLHRHFEGFGKLVFIKPETAFFLNRLHVAFGQFGGFAVVGNDFAVFDFNHAVGLRGDFRVVRHHDNGVAIRIKLADDFHHVFAAAAVERARRFVRKDDFAAVHQRTGDGHALLLAAGKFARLVFLFAFQPQFVQQHIRAAAAFGVADAGIYGRQGNVVARRNGAEQVVALENKAEAFAAQRGQFVRRHFGGFGAGDGISAAGGRVQQAENVHQRGFAGARLPDNGDKIALFDGKVDVFQHVDAVFARAEITVDVFTLDKAHNVLTFGWEKQPARVQSGFRLPE